MNGKMVMPWKRVDKENTPTVRHPQTQRETVFVCLRLHDVWDTFWLAIKALFAIYHKLEIIWRFLTWTQPKKEVAKESNIIKPYQAREAAGIWFTIPCCRIHTWLLWTQEYGAGVSSFSVGKMAWKQNMALYGELHELICASSVIIPSKHIRNKNLHTSEKTFTFVFKFARQIRTPNLNYFPCKYSWSDGFWTELAWQALQSSSGNLRGTK